MLFNLIATLMVGILGACLAYIAHRLTGRRLSRAIIPFTMAFAMIAYSAWNEMTWFTRTAAALPRQFVVVEQGPPVSSPFSPWTYALPRTDSFRVLDRQSVQPLPKSESRFLAQVHVIERYLGSRKTSLIVDCATRQHAEITSSTRFDEAGLPVDVAWTTTKPQNLVVAVLCDKTAQPPVN